MSTGNRSQFDLHSLYLPAIGTPVFRIAYIKWFSGKTEAKQNGAIVKAGTASLIAISVSLTVDKAVQLKCRPSVCVLTCLRRQEGRFNVYNVYIYTNCLW